MLTGFAALLLLSAAGSLFVCARSSAAAVEIRVDGELLRRLEREDLERDQVLEVKTPYGGNVLGIAHGRVRMLRADCPDQGCVRMGELRSGALPIVCLPHRLTVEFVGEASHGEIELDAIAR